MILMAICFFFQICDNSVMEMNELTATPVIEAKKHDEDQISQESDEVCSSTHHHIKKDEQSSNQGIGKCPTQSGKRCSINRSMISSKAVYFFEYAKEGCHWQYLILFYCSMGLTEAQSGLINGLRYGGSAIAAPLLGLFADKKQCHKKLVVFICIMSVFINIFQPLTPILLKETTLLNETYDTVTRSSYASYIQGDATLSEHSNSNTKLFFLMLLVALVGSSFDGSTLTFGDYGIIRKTVEEGTSVGDQRRLGELGYGVGSILSSLVIRYVHIHGASPYAGVFIVYAFLTSALAVSYYFLYSSLKNSDLEAPAMNKQNQSTQETNTRFREDIREAFKQFNTWFFLVTVVINGIPLAFAYSFTFVFLDELQMDPMLFGPSDMLNGSMGFIVYSLAHHIVRLVGGPVNGMALSCFMWFVRFMALSYMEAPWLLFPINLTNGICCALFVYTYMQFIGESYPASIQTTMCGLTNALYFSLSYLLANAVGGGLYREHGARQLFRVQGAACAVWSVVIVVYGIVSKKYSGRKRNAVADLTDQYQTT